MSRGRPLRFLGLVLGGWVALRVALLWPGAAPPPAPAPNAEAPLRLPELEALNLPLGSLGYPPAGLPAAPARARGAAPLARLAPAPAAVRHPADPARAAMALLALATFDPPGATRFADAAAPGAAPSGPTPPAVANAPGARRWSASAWLVARGGAGLGPQGAPQGGQLGGSQAGARLALALGDRLALAARLATPLGAAGAEAAAGVEWRPVRGVRLIAEQRLAIDPGGGGPALGVAGGFGPRALRGFRLEGYGQAGVIGRGAGVYYLDGAARIERRLLRAGHAELALGAGAWGAAQSGAERLDLGPSLGVTLPLGPRRSRLTLDWRARVAGGAAPASGPALTLGADF